MAINYCSIGSTALNGFCSAQRGKVLNRLIAELHPITPNQPAYGGATPVALRNDFNFNWARARGQQQYRPEFDVDVDQPVIDFEQNEITVQVSILGLSGSQTLNVSQAQGEFVSITNLDLEAISNDEIAVNIVGFDL